MRQTRFHGILPAMNLLHSVLPYLQIALSALLVFVLSALSHMVLPWRKGEWGRVTAFEPVQAALRGQGS